MELSKINGREILEFLTNQEEDENLEGTSLNGFYFEDQKVENDTYKLSFMSYFNNWGTYQEINGNSIIIDKKGKVSVYVDEPFEGDGSDRVIKNLLEEWLKTHTFKDNIEEEFQTLIQSGKEKILEIKGFEDKKKIEEVINILRESLTFIK